MMNAKLLACGRDSINSSYYNSAKKVNPKALFMLSSNTCSNKSIYKTKCSKGFSLTYEIFKVDYT